MKGNDDGTKRKKRVKKMWGKGSWPFRDQSDLQNRVVDIETTLIEQLQWWDEVADALKALCDSLGKAGRPPTLPPRKT